MYKSINRLNCDAKINFDDIHSESDEKVSNVIKCVISTWDLERGKNEIPTPITV